MLRILILSIVITACLTDEVNPTVTVDEETDTHEDESRISDHNHGHHHDYSYREDHDHRKSGGGSHEDEDFPQGPVIFRTLDPHGRTPNIVLQNKIISDVFSPDYAQPTVILDYRYLKTGGRDYTRGPGGQILILPKGVHTNEPKAFRNYDELIEHLRLKNIAEQQAMRKKYGIQDYGDGYHQTQYHHEVGRNPHKADHRHGQRLREDLWERDEHRK